jgi:hypothetical protein
MIFPDWQRDAELKQVLIRRWAKSGRRNGPNQIAKPSIINYQLSIPSTGGLALQYHQCEIVIQGPAPRPLVAHS